MDRADLESLTVEQLRNHAGEKWRRYPADVLPAWVAELDYPVAEPVARVVREALRDHDFGYPLDAARTGLPEAFCERMERRFGWVPEREHVVVLSDVVQGVYMALDTLAAADEGVVIQTPIYPPFLHAVRDTGRGLVANPLAREGPRFELDLDGLRTAPNHARVLLFCNPHNPTGRVFARDELEAIAAIALERGWWIVSDEIHADLVYPGGTHIPIASLGAEVAERTITLTSATKAFNIPGLRCAVAACGSASLRARFAERPAHLRGGLGSLGLAATQAAWREGDDWLRSVLELLRENREGLAARLQSEFPGVRFCPPEASYLAWLDFREVDLGGAKSVYRFFLDEARVALSPGEAFGEPGAGFVRLNFGTTRALLAEILERMHRAMSGSRV